MACALPEPSHVLVTIGWLAREWNASFFDVADPVGVVERFYEPITDGLPQFEEHAVGSP